MNFKELVESTLNQSMKNIAPLIILTVVFVGLSTISLGILAPVMFAGYTASLLDMIRTGKEPGPKDVFSRINLFLPLTLFAVALSVAAAIGFLFFFLPGLILLIVITFYLIYMIPSMVDRNLEVVDAIKQSIALVRRADLFDHIIIIVIYSVVQILGGSTLLGMVISMPLSTIFLLLAYDHVTGVPGME